MMIETDVLVVGAGIVGLSIARELAGRYSDLRITVLDKENEAAFHASGRNSGVLHAGFYYDASSLRARFGVIGNRSLTQYCLAHGLDINRCGKVVVAATDEETEGIEELKRRGDRNGVDLKVIDEKELAEIEPNARTCGKALFSPTTSTIRPRQVCLDIARRFPKTVQLKFGRQLIDIRGKTAITGKGAVGFKYLYNAAGLYADKIAQICGVGGQYTMIPFKGIYLQHNDNDLVRCHIYPVPNLKNPFLGVHFTKTVDNHVKIGPTAIPAFWRENYNFRERFQLSEFLEIVGEESRLFLSDSFGFRSLALQEMRKYYRRYFIAESRKLLKQLDIHNFGAFTKPGIRPQLLDKRTRKLVMDFLVENGEASTHVLNSISPAFTTAFSFAEYIVDQSERSPDFPSTGSTSGADH